VRFEDFVTEHGQSLLRLAYVLTGDAHRAEDLTQTALVGAYRHWRKVVSAQKPEAYVRRMLINAHLDWHRRRSSTELPTDFGAYEPESMADPTEGVAMRDQLRHALSILAPRSRAVLVLRYYADLDDASIAEAMCVTTSAVRATASRALTTLRKGGVITALKETS
jgi:RNA polymerase sigma-70 factor (sigma-E family)